jgi:hypothetical protein
VEVQIDTKKQVVWESLRENQNNLAATVKKEDPAGTESTSPKKLIPAVNADGNF